ncbi:MAG: FHA domain-containing protein [Chloroflexota bacterium]
MVSDDVPILIGQSGPLNGYRFPVQNDLLVGRDASCDITIADRQVSRYHARFLVTPDGVNVEDLGSKNGTHCNGQPIQEAVHLQDGDVVQIALVQKFLYVSSDATATMPLESMTQTDLGFQMPRRLRLEKRSRRVWVNEQELVPPLSVSQFRLLELLYERDGRVVDRREMSAVVWGDEEAADVSEQALDALVRRLRDRLAALDPSYQYIITVRGHGLRLDNPPMDI